MLKVLPLQVDPNLLVGHIGADDAGVYRIDDERALVLTVDFFTPIVDDPYDYGRVAAANSLSDVYAMGGRPLAALNIAAFPEHEIPIEALGEIFKGAAAVAKDAETVIVGGHTVKDKEIKFGLSVVGLVAPNEIIQNSGAKAGDRLILTKPLGTGVLSTALKMDALPEEHYLPLVNTMTQLNRHAAEQMQAFGVHACTDVTGYGLLGHAFEMAEASDVTLEIAAGEVPALPGTIDLIRHGYLTAGAHSNRVLVGELMGWQGNPDENLEHLLLDPQTSGGLLIAVSPDKCDALCARIKEVYGDAAIVGSVTQRQEVALRLT